jgi:hypothetical protein
MVRPHFGLDSIPNRLTQSDGAPLTLFKDIHLFLLSLQHPQQPLILAAQQHDLGFGTPQSRQNRIHHLTHAFIFHTEGLIMWFFRQSQDVPQYRIIACLPNPLHALHTATLLRMVDHFFGVWFWAFAVA